MNKDNDLQHQRVKVLERILTNYKNEKQALLKKDPHYFDKILKERAQLIDILRSLDMEKGYPLAQSTNDDQIIHLIDAIAKQNRENRPLA